MSTTDAAGLRRALLDPFPADKVGWKPQTVTKQGGSALAVAYIDARDVMDRLDAVVGVAAWRDSYLEHADGTVTCKLELKIDGEWIPKVDVGDESEQKEPGNRKKAAYSDALKRAAVKWGVGRYLYSLPTFWCKYDAEKRQFSETPRLPAWALPGGAGSPGVAAAPAQPAKPEPAAVETKVEPTLTPRQKLEAYDLELATVGLTKRGDLVKYVTAALKPVHGGNLDEWDEQAWAGARESAKAFVAGKRGLINDQIWRLLECKGGTVEDMAAKAGAPRGTKPEGLTHAQALRVVELLTPLRDVMHKKGA